MIAPQDNATDANASARANDPLPLRAANFLGDTIDALDTLGKRYDEGPRASSSVRKPDGRPARLVAKRERRKQQRHAKTRVAFFRYSYYDIAFRFFVEHVLNAEFVCLPEASKQTLERGAAQSNDFVCAPFKHILGNYIEALDAGADVLVQFTGPCRLGYYGELQESILRDMGYEFEMLNFAAIAGQPLKEYVRTCKKLVNPDLSVAEGIRAMLVAFKMIECLDAYNDHYLERAGFGEKAEVEKARSRFFGRMGQVATRHDVEAAFRTGVEELDAATGPLPENPIRIGIVGEYFTAVDPQSNLDVERKLLDMKVSLARVMNITNRNIRYNEPELRREVEEYVEYDTGPTSTLTIAAAKRYAEEGFDGIVHLKSSGCTPEIDCMPVLQRISRDYRIPVLFLSYDSQTSDTGLDTRLEAFYDMIAMRKAAR